MTNPSTTPAGTNPVDTLRDRGFIQDVTDEDGMRAAAAAGGFGIKVGEGETCAPHRLRDVAAVQAWLAGVADAR